MNRYTTTVIFCLAVLTGVLNYYGLAQFVPPGAWFQLILCAMTGFGVTLAISLFWSYAFHTIPELMTPRRRIGGWVTLVFGVLMILAVSTYWNLIAFAGSEIARLSSGDVVAQAELALAQAIEASGLFRSFLSDIAAFNADVSAIVDAEINGGGTSNTTGPGPISGTFGQVADKLNNLFLSIQQGDAALAELRIKGDACLAGLQSAAASGNSGGVAKQIACVNGVIGDLAGQNVLSAIDRGMRTLTDGIVLPATVRTDLQRSVIASFMGDQQTRADGIAALLAGVEVPLIEPVSSAMPNRMMGVLLHWQSIIPAIATAAAIDLLPAVILVFKTLFTDDRRDRGEPSGHWTAEELADALHQAQKLRDQMDQGTHKLSDTPEPDFIDLPEEDWSDLDDGADGDDTTEGSEN